MNKLDKGIRFIKKIGDGIYDFIDDYNNDSLYLFDLKDVKEQYHMVLKGYKNYPHLFDVVDFARNYSFSFYQKKGLLDNQKDLPKMEREVFEYILKIREKEAVLE